MNESKTSEKSLKSSQSQNYKKILRNQEIKKSSSYSKSIHLKNEQDVSQIEQIRKQNQQLNIMKLSEETRQVLLKIQRFDRYIYTQQVDKIAKQPITNELKRLEKIKNSHREMRSKYYDNQLTITALYNHVKLLSEISRDFQEVQKFKQQKSAEEAKKKEQKFKQIRLNKVKGNKEVDEKQINELKKSIQQNLKKEKYLQTRPIIDIFLKKYRKQCKQSQVYNLYSNLTSVIRQLEFQKNLNNDISSILKKINQVHKKANIQEEKLLQKQLTSFEKKYQKKDIQEYKYKKIQIIVQNLTHLTKIIDIKSNNKNQSTQKNLINKNTNNSEQLQQLLYNLAEKISIPSQISKLVEMEKLKKKKKSYKLYSYIFTITQQIVSYNRQISQMNNYLKLAGKLYQLKNNTIENIKAQNQKMLNKYKNNELLKGFNENLCSLIQSVQNKQRYCHLVQIEQLKKINKGDRLHLDKINRSAQHSIEKQINKKSLEQFNKENIQFKKQIDSLKKKIIVKQEQFKVQQCEDVNLIKKINFQIMNYLEKDKYQQALQHIQEQKDINMYKNFTVYQICIIISSLLDHIIYENRQHKNIIQRIKVQLQDKQKQKNYVKQKIENELNIYKLEIEQIQNFIIFFAQNIEKKKYLQQEFWNKLLIQIKDNNTPKMLLQCYISLSKHYEQKLQDQRNSQQKCLKSYEDEIHKYTCQLSNLQQILSFKDSQYKELLNTYSKVSDNQKTLKRRDSSLRGSRKSLRSSTSSQKEIQDKGNKKVITEFVKEEKALLEKMQMMVDCKQSMQIELQNSLKIIQNQEIQNKILTNQLKCINEQKINIQLQLTKQKQNRSQLQEEEENKKQQYKKQQQQNKNNQNRYYRKQQQDNQDKIAQIIKIVTQQLQQSQITIHLQNKQLEQQILQRQQIQNNHTKIVEKLTAELKEVNLMKLQQNQYLKEVEKINKEWKEEVQNNFRLREGQLIENQKKLYLQRQELIKKYQKEINQVQKQLNHQIIVLKEQLKGYLYQSINDKQSSIIGEQLKKKSLQKQQYLIHLHEEQLNYQNIEIDKLKNILNKIKIQRQQEIQNEVIKALEYQKQDFNKFLQKHDEQRQKYYDEIIIPKKIQEYHKKLDQYNIEEIGKLNNQKNSILEQKIKQIKQQQEKNQTILIKTKYNQWESTIMQPTIKAIRTQMISKLAFQTEIMKQKFQQKKFLIEMDKKINQKTEQNIILQQKLQQMIKDNEQKQKLNEEEKIYQQKIENKNNKEIEMLEKINIIITQKQNQWIKQIQEKQNNKVQSFLSYERSKWQQQYTHNNNQQINKLTEVITQQRQQIKDLKNRIKEYIQKIVVKQEEYEFKQQYKNKIQETITELKKQEIKNRQSSLINNNNMISNVNLQLQNQIFTIKKTCELKDKQIEFFKEQNQANLRQIDKLSIKLSAQEHKVHKLQQNISKYKLELEDIKIIKLEMEHQITSKIVKENQLMNKLKQYQYQNAEQKLQWKQQRQSKLLMIKQKQFNQQILIKLHKDTLKELEKELQKQKQQLQNSTKNNKYLCNELQILKKQLFESELLNEKLEFENRKLSFQKRQIDIQQIINIQKSIKMKTESQEDDQQLILENKNLRNKILLINNNQNKKFIDQKIKLKYMLKQINNISNNNDRQKQITLFNKLHQQVEEMMQLNHQLQIKLKIIESNEKINQNILSVLQIVMFMEHQLKCIYKNFVKQNTLTNSECWIEWSKYSQKILEENNVQKYLQLWYLRLQSILQYITNSSRQELKQQSQQMIQLKEQMKDILQKQIQCMDDENEQKIQQYKNIFNDIKLLLQEYFFKDDPQCIIMMANCLGMKFT